MINVLVWLLAFLMQAGLLGIVMYSVRKLLVSTLQLCSFVSSLGVLLQLISLSDLENDFVNPHDASAALNKWVVRVWLAYCICVQLGHATNPSLQDIVQIA